MALTDSIVSYWKLDETSSTRVDAVIATGNDLTDDSSVGAVAGKILNAAHFVTASTDSLSHADNASLSTGDIDFTLAFWVKLTDTLATYPLIAKVPTSGQDGDYFITYNSVADRFRFAVYDSGSTTKTIDADTLGSPADATYYFIVAWHDATGNTINIQVNNGTADSVAETVTIGAGSGAFKIGAFSDGALFLNGDVDEVGFWKRVLTAGEKTQLYNSGNGLSYPFAGGTSGLQGKIWG